MVLHYLRMRCRRVSSIAAKSAQKSETPSGGGANTGPRPSSSKTAEAQVTGAGQKTGSGWGSGGRSFNVEREVSYCIYKSMYVYVIFVHACK